MSRTEIVFHVTAILIGIAICIFAYLWSGDESFPLGFIGITIVFLSVLDMRRKEGNGW